jgi:hypothetical protein
VPYLASIHGSAEQDIERDGFQDDPMFHGRTEQMDSIAF